MGCSTADLTVSSRLSLITRIPLILGIIFIVIAPAWSQEFWVFGPTDFVRTEGGPVTETVSFTVLNPDGKYEMRLLNGGANGQYELVTSADILLNGSLVFRERDFKKKKTVLSASVSLLTENELSIFLDGTAGVGFTLELIGIDRDKPVITATTDPERNADGWFNSDATVTFECSDATTGIEFCPEPAFVDTEGAGQQLSSCARGNALSPDGRSMLSSENEDVWLINITSCETLNLTVDSADFELNPQWWPARPGPARRTAGSPG